MRKKILSIILSLILVLGVIPFAGLMSFASELQTNGDGDTVYVSSTGDDTTGNGTQASPYATVQKAVDAIVGSGTVILLSDITVNTAVSNGFAFEITGGKDIILDGGNHKIINTVKPFCVSDSKLTLKDVDIDMNNTTYSTTPIPIQILPGGELILESGSIIENATVSNSSYCFGILHAFGGNITMEDGAIIRNLVGQYGVIRVQAEYESKFYNTAFVMNGGTITNCESTRTEGVVFYISCGATFTMNGGIIENNGKNNSKNAPGTVFLHANGGDRGYNEFTATGGTISGNSATYGGVVYSNASQNRINISGNVNFTDNNGNYFGGTSNIYLDTNGLYINLTGGMGSDSMVGVYTKSTPSNSNDIKIAVNASMGDAAHFVSDKMASSGVIYDDGTKCWTSSGNEVPNYHHTNEANTLWLSTASVVYYVNNGTPEANKDTANGYLTIDKTLAAENDTVNVTAIPNDGYELKSLKYNDGSDHDITEKKSFTMPAANVTVTAVFEEIPSHTHTKGTSYMTDGKAHWLTCAGEDCPLKTVEDYLNAFADDSTGAALKEALGYKETVDKGGLMGRQGLVTNNVVSQTQGRTIIGLTQAQLNSIDEKLLVIGCDENGKEIKVEVDCAYTYFYDLQPDGSYQKIEAKNFTSGGKQIVAFVIIDKDQNSEAISGYGYYRLYNGTADTESNFITDVLYLPKKEK